MNAAARKAVNWRRAVPAVVLNALMILFSITCIFPLVWMFLASLKTQKEFNSGILSLPKNPSFANYIDVLSRTDTSLPRAVLNSARVTAVSIVFIVVFGYIVGYILSRVRFRGSGAVYALFLLGMLVPIHALMVPVYVLFSKAGFTDSLWTLPIPYVAFGMPIAIFLVRGYVGGIPSSIEEAAAIDGSSFSRTLFLIIMPMCKPILATVAIIQTFACWNEFAFALTLLSNARRRTVPLELAELKGQYSSNYTLVFATMVLAMLPAVAFYFVFSKQIMKGMVAGAVKG